MKNSNLAGKKRSLLVLLLVWQMFKLAALILLGFAVVAVAGIPILLIMLGALLMFPNLSRVRKRALIVAWW